MTAHEDFWERVDKTDSCWLWLGHIDSKGYGRIATWRNGTIFAHRLAYELTNGPIPARSTTCAAFPPASTPTT